LKQRPEKKFIKSSLLNILSLCIILLPAAILCDGMASNDSSHITAINNGYDFTGKKIATISFYGNIITKEKTLRMFLKPIGIYTGELYDSAKISYAKKKLKLTNLYSRVDIIPIEKDDGVHLFIILREVFYLIPDFVGGDRVERKHGNTIDWYRLHLGVTRYNFRGNMESLTLGSTIWDDRAIYLVWTKPMFPSPYSISIGGAAEYYPDNNYPENRFIANGRVYLSRRMTLHSRAGLGIIPSYTKIEHEDGTVFKIYKEMITSANYCLDFRNDNYDPVKGWFFNESISTNSVYADGVNRYGQFRTDIYLYFPGIFNGNHIAFRIQSVLRTNNGGNYKRLYIGGDPTVRGFPALYLGINDTMNDYAAISSEYRFHLFTTPVLDFGPLSEHIKDLQNFFYDVEGALIADAGHLWHDFPHPFDRRQNGAGIGAGLNIKVPSLRVTGCFDVVWPVSKETDRTSKNYNRTVIYSVPAWHLYLSTF
jgi:outer membrane protein assembly factor BamA